MLASVLSWAARNFGDLSTDTWRQVIHKILITAAEQIRGAEKQKKVIDWLNFPEDRRWIAQTVVQIAYAVARMKGLVK